MGAKTSSEAREAIRLIREGLTVQEAAKQAGVHTSTVWRLIRKEGIDYRKPKKDII